MSFALLHRTLPALAISALIALPVAGCGSDTSSSGGASGPDPAASIPASAPLYLEAHVRPEGDQKAGVDALARKLLGGQDAGTAVVTQINKALHEQGLTFTKDVDPWLGDRIGLAVTRLGAGEDSDAVVVLASRDDDRAQAFVDSRKATVAREYQGVTYRYRAKDDVAAAVHDHAVLVGTEAAVKSAIDAAKGRSLAETGVFKEARDEVDPDSVGLFYVDPTRAIDGALNATAVPQANALKGLLGGTGLRSIAAGLTVTETALNVNAAIIGVKRPAGSGETAAAVAAAPAGSWLSVGMGDVGQTLKTSLAQLAGAGGAGGSGLDPQALLAGLGIDLEKDLLSWMGDATLFVRGTSPADLAGALVVRSKDPAASQRAIGALRQALTTAGLKPTTLRDAPSGATGLHLDVGALPGGLAIAAQGDRFVVALGADALRGALASGATLGDGDAYRAAAGLLQDTKPMLFLDVPQVVGLLSGLTGSSAVTGAAKAIGPAVAGIDGKGDVTHVEVAIALR